MLPKRPFLKFSEKRYKFKNPTVTDIQPWLRMRFAELPNNLFAVVRPKFARRDGVEVAGLTVDWTILVRFRAYPHRVLAPWWQGGERRLRRPGARVGVVSAH